MRIKNLMIAGVAILGTSLCGCFMMNSSTISSEAAKGTVVTASATDWGILHLTIPQGLTANVNGQLLSQCQAGKISNVATELDTREFFVAQMYTVAATGVCQ